MLSRPVQHKSSFADASAACLARKTTKSAMPLPMAQSLAQSLKSALPMIIAASMSMMLTGCGFGNSATTRIIDPPPYIPPPAPTYNLTVESPVRIENVRVTLTDTKTGDLISQTTIANGNTSVIAVPGAYLKNTDITLVTLSPIVGGSSKYFDPMLNNQQGAMASFNQPLHALVSTGTINTKIKVDPFSEIVYQRALVRSGTVNLTAPSLNKLTLTQLDNATTELTQALGTRATRPYSVLFNSPATIAAINIYLPAIIPNPPAVNYASSDAVIALGQLALYARNNLSDATPYLNFAARAALDMRDGDFDGMTIFGGDTDGTVVIANPILYSGVTSQPNNDPDNTSADTLKTLNSNQRIQTGMALMQATTSYFNSLNASLPVPSRIDSASLSYILGYDYGVFNQSYASYTSPTVNVAAGRVGAGNYTPAFGLATLPTRIDFKNKLDASDASGRSNSIVQLNGVYQSTASPGCQLSVGYDGTIQFKQGSQVYEAVISRKFSDSLTRITGNQYLLNVAASDETSPRFIQVNTVGATISSATTGRSAQQTPTVLDTTDLTCTF
jgi:hypothetical protein